MSFTVEYSDDGGSTYNTINYQDFGIDYGVSDVLLAPIASVDVARTVGASTGDRLRIQENGTTRFVGRLTTGGKVTRNGQTKLKAEHDIYPVFADSVSITVTNPTDEDVYQAALSAANGGGGFTLDYQPTPVSLGDDYDVDDRSVKRIFRDMTDRTDRVFFVGVGDTITVDTRGGGGQFASISAGDPFRVEQYNPGDINTVRNAVTVNGTGGERVTATAEDSTSISDFGRRAETFNYSYIRTATEAQDMADELLVPNPLASGEILLGQSVGGGATGEIINQTLDFDDPQGSGASDDLTIERQIINPSSVTVNVGEGAGVSIANVNRDSKSQDDTTEPGSVYDTDRLADGAVDGTKLEDGAVQSIKLEDGAVQSIKLADGSVLTTKIGDEEVTADKITTGTIRGADFTRISDGEVVGTEEIINLVADKVQFVDAGDNLSNLTQEEAGVTVIEGGRIETGSIDADKIDTLDLDADQITINDPDPNSDTRLVFEIPQTGDIQIRPESAGIARLGTGFDPFNEAIIQDINPQSDDTGQIGNTSFAHSEIWAHDFVNAVTEESIISGDPVNDGGDPLATLGENPEPPEDMKVRDDNGDVKGLAIGTLAQYAYELCSAQQRRIDDLEARLSKLEAQQ
jgi:hypothetical protein